MHVVQYDGCETAAAVVVTEQMCTNCASLDHCR